VKGNVHIRWVIRRDLDEIVDIDRESFAIPWAEKDYVGHLRKRNSIGMVAENDEHRILGFVMYTLGRRRLWLTRLAVNPHFRRKGVGAQLIMKLKGKLASQGRAKIVIDVDEHDLPTQLFLKSLSFECVEMVETLRNDGQSIFRFEFTAPEESKLRIAKGPVDHAIVGTQSEPLTVYISPGDADTEAIADFYVALDVLYRACGGSGLRIVEEDVGKIVGEWSH
jgi:ribosomal-protein-alanine N-acetyltransferase